MKKICYCPVCQTNREFVIVKNNIHCVENDISFEFEESIAKCSICNEELFVEEINEVNQKAYEKAYRDASLIITNDEINEIINKYRISKRNLSLVLGFGELTITRYLDGYVPIKKNSELLKDVLKSPELYLKYLNKNKSLIKESVYKKSKNQIDELLNINENDQYIEDVAEYIIKNNEETTNLVLQKLLYYTEVFYMLFKNKKLFKSACGAWEHGPAYGRIYYEYKEFGKEAIDKDFDDSDLDGDIKSLLDEIIKNFGIYSGKVLAYFTHHESPWKYARDNNLPIINEDLIRELANNIKKEYDIKNYNDISKYSNKKLEEYNSNI